MNKLVAELPFKGDMPLDVTIRERPLKSLDDIEQLFKFYLHKGIGDERYVVSKELFDTLKKAAEKVAREKDLGGNASTMAVRAYMEGCFVKLGFPINEEYYAKYFNSDKERALVVGGLKSIHDVHLSINYYRNDNIWGVKSPRSNRIFLNHDVENNRMGDLDKFLETLDRVDVIVLGGTQLPSNFNHFRHKLLKMRGILNRPENLGRLLHLESSAFSNYTFYEAQFDILLSRV